MVKLNVKLAMEAAHLQLGFCKCKFERTDGPRFHGQGQRQGRGVDDSAREVRRMRTRVTLSLKDGEKPVDAVIISCVMGSSIVYVFFDVLLSLLCLDVLFDRGSQHFVSRLPSI